MLLLSALNLSATILAQSPKPKCPVALGRVEVSYRHDGGESKPQLQLSFQNESGKPVSNVVFKLMLLDSGGYPREYAHEFIYNAVLEPGKTKIGTWKLDPESVDIHRTGASALVEKLTYSDDTTWADDGSESCSVTMDYHPR